MPMPVMKENDRRQNSGLPFVGGRAESSSIEPVDCVGGGSADTVILEVENFEVILREWVRVMVGNYPDGREAPSQPFMENHSGAS